MTEKKGARERESQNGGLPHGLLQALRGHTNNAAIKAFEKYTIDLTSSLTAQHILPDSAALNCTDILNA